MRYLILLAALAAPALYAQFNYYSGSAGGYAVTQHDLVPPTGSNFSAPGGVAWDPAGPDLYFYDADAHTIQRFDTAAQAPAATALFDVPNPVFGPYVDDIEFDPNITTDLYLLESGAQVVHKLRRSGPDSLDAAFGNSGVLTSTMLPMYPYDLCFDGFSRLFCSGADSFGTPVSGVWFVNRDTLAFVQIVDLLTAAGSDISGPIAFDSAGNLFVLLPPPYPNAYPLRIVKFTKAQVDAAIAAAGTAPLTVGDGVLVVDAGANFPNGGRAAFHHESGVDVLYWTGNMGEVYRSDLSVPAYTQFAFAATPDAGDTNYPSALAIESGPFRPYSGDTARLATVLVTLDATYVTTQVGLCIFQATGATAAVDSLAITDQPGSVSNGVNFRFEVELRDPADVLMSNETGAVSVQVLSGSGSLGGATYRVTAGGVAVFDDLHFTGASGSVILRFSLAGTGVYVDSPAINVTSDAGGSGSSSSDNGGCVATDSGRAWPVLAGLLALALVARRWRRVARR
jgi:hypothetical protein